MRQVPPTDAMPAADELTSIQGLTQREVALVAAVANMASRIVHANSHSAASLSQAEEEFEFGEIRVDVTRRIVYRQGSIVLLRPKEYDLLVALARRPGAAVSNETLRLEVWQGRVSPSSRTVAQHVCTLRKQLEDDPERPQHLLTVAKFGYRLVGRWVNGRP